MIGNNESAIKNRTSWTRRRFLKLIGAGSVAAVGGMLLGRFAGYGDANSATFIASVSSYDSELRKIILSGFQQLGIKSKEIKGKRILLKPNLVEPRQHLEHINTHPLVIRGAVEAFLSLGAAEVFVAEGAGHRRDSLIVLDESGLADVLYEDRIQFIDLNGSSVIRVKNQGQTSRLEYLYFPEELQKADIIVSIAKMKTHHWTGVTLSMKNMFGVMPGLVYGWPKNVLHWAGIHQSIFDINATLKPQLAIVDGIVGMEGDGPIMGEPVRANVVVMGRNLPAVDATCARIMGINPHRIPYLNHASGKLGPIGEEGIEQRGETIRARRKDFKLIDSIPAQQGIRM
jgi:uncharacterized protein (DUF362 family)